MNKDSIDSTSVVLIQEYASLLVQHYITNTHGPKIIGVPLLYTSKLNKFHTLKCLETLCMHKDSYVG